MTEEPKPRPVPEDQPRVEPAPPEACYEKPRLRRYDQIDQVRPYGPSEV